MAGTPTAVRSLLDAGAKGAPTRPLREAGRITERCPFGSGVCVRHGPSNPRVSWTPLRVEPFPSLLWGMTLMVPLVSRTTAATSERSPDPVERTACSTSDSLRRFLRSWSCRSSPEITRATGRAVTAALAPGTCADAQATTNCSPASSASAVSPSKKATSELSRIVARVDPMATVTMKSNALSCPRVLLPETRRISAQESNQIGFLPGPGPGPGLQHYLGSR